MHAYWEVSCLLYSGAHRVNLPGKEGTAERAFKTKFVSPGTMRGGGGLMFAAECGFIGRYTCCSVVYLLIQESVTLAQKY